MISAVGSNAASANSATGQQVKTVANGDFETFLKMLTAQIQNQDPLNPMEGSDFAVQLATFSGVEQQVRTNDLLVDLARQMGASGLSQLSGWIGKEARTTAPVYFGNSALTLDVAPDERADSVVLVTMNQAGREMTREEIGPGTGQIEWLGKDALGGKLPDGLYSFRAESYREGELIGESDVGAYARISEAELTDKGVMLVFEGGGSALSEEITALRGGGNG